MANLKMLCTFVDEGQATPAINQLDSFIYMVKTDIAKGDISQEAVNLMDTATNLINTMRS